MVEVKLRLSIRNQMAGTVIRRIHYRLDDEAGQTAAEYIGIILVVVAVIAAVVAWKV